MVYTLYMVYTLCMVYTLDMVYPYTWYLPLHGIYFRSYSKRNKKNCRKRGKHDVTKVTHIFVNLVLLTHLFFQLSISKIPRLKY